MTVDSGTSRIKNHKIPAFLSVIDVSDVPVYPSREPFLELGSIPMLTDFGQLREDDDCINQDWIMTDSYQAPEVLLQIPWTFQLDMRFVGVMVSDSCEKSQLLF